MQTSFNKISQGANSGPKGADNPEQDYQGEHDCARLGHVMPEHAGPEDGRQGGALDSVSGPISRSDSCPVPSLARIYVVDYNAVYLNHSYGMPDQRRGVLDKTNKALLRELSALSACSDTAVVLALQHRVGDFAELALKTYAGLVSATELELDVRHFLYMGEAELSTYLAAHAAAHIVFVGRDDTTICACRSRVSVDTHSGEFVGFPPVAYR